MHRMLETFPKPDLTILLRIEPQESLNRKPSISVAEARGPQYLRDFTTRPQAFLAFQQRVLDAYDFLSTCYDFAVVPDGGQAAPVADNVKRKVLQKFGHLFQ